MKSIQKYSIEEILSKKNSFFSKTNQVNIRLFKKKGITCINCGEKGYFFKKIGKSYILFTENNIMMTKDHIFPKSKGGSNNLQNLQPMCSKCNSEKADIIL